MITLRTNVCRKEVIIINNIYSQEMIRKNIVYKDSDIIENEHSDNFYPIAMESVNFNNWIAVLGLNTCKFCRDMHGKIYWLNETPEREPPVHINCRCKIESMNSIIAGNATKDGDNGADWYLKYTGILPNYYVTVSDDYKVGWKRGKSLKKYISGKMITGGIYRNENNHLPNVLGRIWYEADINYYEGKRNSHRILWSNDGLMFVTYDHYTTFYEII